jgi:hypothetical protein
MESVFIYILEVNINNQLNHAYSSDNKENLLKQVSELEEQNDEYYFIYYYDIHNYDNSIHVLFENKSIGKIKYFLSIK